MTDEKEVVCTPHETVIIFCPYCGPENPTEWDLQHSTTWKIKSEDYGSHAKTLRRTCPDCGKTFKIVLAGCTEPCCNPVEAG